MTRSTLIRADDGRVRVLRLSTIGRVLMQLAYDVEAGESWCRRCGCTDTFGCAGGGCYWVDAAQTLCSRCLEKELLP